jgi:PAS domain S-box-containing protein
MTVSHPMISESACCDSLTESLGGATVSTSPTDLPAASDLPSSSDSLAADVSTPPVSSAPLPQSDTPPADLTPFSPDFFQAAVNQAGIAIVGMDVCGTVQTFNQTATHLLNRSATDVIGKTFDAIVPIEYRVMASRALQRTLQQRSVNQFEMQSLTPGAKNPLYLAVIFSCVLDGQGACRGIMAWIRDISNRKELETHLTRTRHMAAVGTLAAGVAHHFNNIVCGMNTMVEFAITTDDPITMRRALRMSSEAASRIGYITQSLLAMNCGDSQDEPDLTDLTEEIFRFADAVEPTLQKKGITLTLDLQGGRVAAVPKQTFGQLLQHLLKNAEEAFAAHCGSEMIGSPINGGREKVITLRTRSQSDQIMFQFSDTGCGIPAENLPSVFDPFFTTKSVRCGGTASNPGLGLTIAHGVALDMGGHIWVDSLENAGTTVNLLFPITV